jgi:hypothetical protein
VHPMARQPTFAVHISLTVSLKNVYSDLAERLLQISDFSTAGTVPSVEKKRGLRVAIWTLLV